MIIRGSYGTITIDRITGSIISYEPFDADDAQYSDIVRFDPATLPDVPECDILGVGFWDDKGGYEHPMEWSETEGIWIDTAGPTSGNLHNHEGIRPKLTDFTQDDMGREHVCSACGREENECSDEPCAAVVADREC